MTEEEAARIAGEIIDSLEWLLAELKAELSPAFPTERISPPGAQIVAYRVLPIPEPPTPPPA